MRKMSFAVIIGLFLLALPIHGSIETVYQFAPSNIHGINPYGDLVSDGTYFYGVTFSLGDYNGGNVFKAKIDGTEFTVLHSFPGSAGVSTDDGRKPYGSLILSGTTLYGMTLFGGDYGEGTIFKIETDSSGFALLHEFAGSFSDGARPCWSSLVLSGSTLYGMTSEGGDNNMGTIFGIETSGGAITLLHEFAGGPADGAFPYGSLTLSGTTLYGMTLQGGDGDVGTIFMIDSGTTVFTLMHEFAGGPADGASPTGSLLLSGSTLYGMTEAGGDDDAGTIFMIETASSVFTLLHEFDWTNGGYPEGSLILDGTTAYGMTNDGGANSMGTVFKFDTSGFSGLTVLHEFAGGTGDGAFPYGSLILSGSTLYGMTNMGGDTNTGTLFSINTSGGAITMLYEFTCVSGSDGSVPRCTPVLMVTTLYGITAQGGGLHKGTVFKVEKNGSGYAQLHEFIGGVDDGLDPIYGSLISDGTALYGMTYSGGDNNRGTIFKIGTDGTFTLLHEFAGGAGDGRGPFGSLILSGTTLYGMTRFGGAPNRGTIFKIDTSGGAITVLHEFAGGTDDGMNPYGSLVLSDTTLYGMTYAGGDSNFGTVFKIETSGGTITLLHEFAGGTDDGKWPYGSLVVADSTLYGMTRKGGDSDFGTVFKLPTAGGSFTLLHEFAGGVDDGSNPYGDLLLSDSILYGTTSSSGDNDCGIVFKVGTNGLGYSLLHKFVLSPTSGRYPFGSLILSDGTFFGTTTSGGNSSGGIVFALTLPGITVTSPNGGESWTVGDSHDITWSSTGTITNVNIDYSINGGSDWISVATNETNDGTYAWTVPNAPSSTCLVRVSDTDNDPLDTSDAAFTIVLPSTLTISGTITTGGSPLADVVMSGLPGNPTTNASGFYTATVSYGWSGTVTPSLQYFTFTPASTTYSGIISSQTTDYTASLTQSLVVTAPAAEALWEKGKTYTITWLKQGAQNANVKILLYKGAANLVKTIIATTANDGAYDWLVPTTLTVGSTYFIKVKTVDNLIYDDSDKFSIIVPTITITAPTTGTIWVKNATKTITWTMQGTQDANVKIQLYKGASKKLDITLSTSNNGTYDWPIPSILANGANYTVHITTLDGKVKGTSKAFTIAIGMINVTQPAAGSIWQRGLPHIITWTSEGTVDASVKIRLYKGSLLKATLAASTANDGSFEWTIPAAQVLAANYKIRITTVDNLVRGDSGKFTISSSVALTLLAPNGGEILKPTETKAIRWTDDPNVLEVKLEFSRDNGSSFTTVADHVPDTGSYDWIAPVNFTRNGIVRVSDSNGKLWRDDGLLEFSFKFIYGGEGEEPGAVFWFGGSDQKAPGYGFARIEIGSDRVQFGGIAKTIELLAADWHELRVRFDFHRDTAEIRLDDQVLFENAALNTTQKHYFQPCLVMLSGGKAPLAFTMDDLAMNIVQLDNANEDKLLFNALSENFDRYDERSNTLGNCWQLPNANDEENKVQLNVENQKNKSLQLLTEAGKQLLIYLPFSLPDKVPFDISDKNMVIENQ